MKATEETALKEVNELNELDDNKSSDQGKREETSSMTKTELLILISTALIEFILGIYLSMLAPFFPNEARKKGASHFMIGLIIGMYSITLFIMSPIMGYNIGKIGPKFMLIAGLISCGVCSILFGFMNRSPPGAPFLSLCVILMIVEGIGSAAFITASYSFIAELFPDKTATFLGILQTFTCIGMTVGPPMGGLLFQAGGFPLPFIITGVLLIILGIPQIILLPNNKGDLVKKAASMTKHLKNYGGLFHLSAAMVGVFFLIASITSAICSPILGLLADKKPKFTIWVLVAGSMISSVSLFLLEPASTNLIHRAGLVMIIVTLIAEGFSMGLMGPAFQLLLEMAQYHKLPDNFETYGLMSSIITSSISLGGFIGPLIAGAMIDGLGFGKASTTAGYIMVAVTFVTLIGAIWLEVKKAKPKQNDEEELKEE